MPERLMIPIFAELIRWVTPFALLKVLQQYDLLASKNLLPCYHALRTSMGLPCYHEIRNRLYKKDILHLSDIHERWYFTRPVVGPILVAPGQPLLMNPHVIKSKGWPRKSKNKTFKGKTSTRRESSGFEIELEKETGRRQGLRPRK